MTCLTMTLMFNVLIMDSQVKATLADLQQILAEEQEAKLGQCVTTPGIQTSMRRSSQAVVAVCGSSTCFHNKRDTKQGSIAEIAVLALALSLEMRHHRR